MRGGSVLSKQSRQLRASSSIDYDNKSRSIVNPRGSVLTYDEVSDDDFPLQVAEENELKEEKMKLMRAVSSYPCTDA